MTETSIIPSYDFDKLTGWRLNLPDYIEPGTRVLCLYRVSTGKQLYHTDDNEPDGPAGMPILEVIKNKKLFCTAVVVTRYFGGIKLGAGGLVRAYSGCAAENLESAPKLMYMPCEEYLFTVGYDCVDICNRYFGLSDCEVKNTEYSSSVIFTVAVKKEQAAAFTAAIYDRLNGRIDIKKLREFVCGFKL